MGLLEIRRICLSYEKFLGGKSYVARQTRDVAKEATFKHLVQTGLHTDHRRIPPGVRSNLIPRIIFKLE